MGFNLNSLRTSLALNILPKRTMQQALTNTFNEAFFAYVGAGLTRYDYRGQAYLDKGYNDNSDVYSVVSQISRKFASVPGLLYDVKDSSAKSKWSELATKALDPQKYSQKLIWQQKAFSDTEYQEPLERPNWYQSESEYKELWETFMLLTGNAYQWILRVKEGANAGKPMARFLLPSHLVQIVLKEDAKSMGLESPIDYYMLVFGNAYIRFEAEDVIHSKFPNPNYDLQGSQLYGQSPLRSALIDMQIQNEAKLNGAKTMLNGGVFGFIHAKDGQTALTKDQADELKGRLIEMQASAESLGMIAGASASLGFTQISVDTEKLQPFEYLKSSQKSICNNLGWSDKLLNNDDGAKYDNLQSAWKMSISNRIAPDLKIYEEGLNTHYYPYFKGYENVKLTFDVSELPEMQSDMKLLVEWMAIALENGAITPREFRLALKYSDVDTEEMNTHFIRQGLIPVQDALMPDAGLVNNFGVNG